MPCRGACTSGAATQLARSGATDQAPKPRRIQAPCHPNPFTSRSSCRRSGCLHQVRTVSTPFLAAECDAGAHSGERVSAFRHDGEGRRIPGRSNAPPLGGTLFSPGPAPIRLVIWHGFNATLILSVVTLAGSIALFLYRDAIRRRAWPRALRTERCTQAPSAASRTPRRRVMVISKRLPAGPQRSSRPRRTCRPSRRPASSS